MVRYAKIEVAAVNLRIPSPKRRDYVGLIKALEARRKGYRVHGDTHVAILWFDEEKLIGTFAKYTEINLAGDWFNTIDFQTATAEDIENINIPPSLKPNLSIFYFLLEPKLHSIAFEAYSESKSLSLDAVRRYFDAALSEQVIVSRFGRVEATIVSNQRAARRLMNLPDIKEVRLLIRRPNPDDVDDDLAEVIERRLRQQKADQYEESLKVSGKQSIKPNSRTKKLAAVAAENGDVAVKSLVNGVMVTHHATSTPLKEVEKYPSDEATQPRFIALAHKVFSIIGSSRRQTRA